MHQNARQILDIVRGTFPTPLFDGSTAGKDCTSPQTDGETLSCLWSRVESSMNDPGQDYTDKALQASTKVCGKSGSSQE